jgi:hypothetical protein
MSNYRPNLSPQQERFCDEYLVSFNAYRAAIAAGYSENTAAKGEMLHLPKVQDYLKLKMGQRAERLEISHDMILRELAKIAFSNMGNYYDEVGDLRRMCDLSERDKAALSHWEVTNVVEPDGYRVGTITKIKLHNKMSALDKIARHLGFYGVAGGKVASGELRVASLESEVASDELPVVSLKEEVAEESVAGDGLRVASLEEEVVRTALVDAEQDKGGKILTLSPLFGRNAVSDPDATVSELVTAGVDDFMQELLLRGTSD